MGTYALGLDLRNRKALRQPCIIRRSWQGVYSGVYSSRSARHLRDLANPILTLRGNLPVSFGYVLRVLKKLPASRNCTRNLEKLRVEWANMLSLTDFRHEGSCPPFVQRASPEMKDSLI
jgi:hypothetical protein